MSHINHHRGETRRAQRQVRPACGCCRNPRRQRGGYQPRRTRQEIEAAVAHAEQAAEARKA